MSNPQVTAVISAQDNASPVLAAIAKTAGQLARQFNDLKVSESATGSLRNIDRALQETTRHAEQNAAAIGKIAAMFKVAAGAALGFAAIKLKQVEVKAIKAGEGIDTERAHFAVAGIPKSEREAAERQARELTSIYKNVTTENAMEIYRDTRSQLTHREEVPHVLPTLVQAKSVLDSMDPTGGLSHGLAQITKGAESAGITQDPARFEHFIDSAVRAMQVTGKTLNPQHINELLKYEKSSAALLSDRFNTTAGLSLAQEIGGSTAGTGIDQAIKQLTSGFSGPNHVALKEFARLGLVRSEDVDYNKNGTAKGLKPGRNAIDSDVMQRDPLAYMKGTLLPAFQKAGITEVKDQVAEIRRLWPSGRAADVMTKLLTQMSAFENHAKLYDEALGLKGTEEYAKTAATGVQAFNASLHDLGATLTADSMGTASKVLDSIASGLRKATGVLKEFQVNHPDMAGGFAVLTGGITAAVSAGLSGGSIALIGSAWSLKGSAAALTVAAEKLALSGALPGKGLPVAPTIAPGIPVAGAGIGAGTILGGFALVGGMIGIIAANASDALKKGLTEAQAAVDKLKLSLPDKSQMINPGMRNPDGTLPGKGLPFVPGLPDDLDFPDPFKPKPGSQVVGNDTRVKKMLADFEANIPKPDTNVDPDGNAKTVDRMYSDAGKRHVWSDTPRFDAPHPAANPAKVQVDTTVQGTVDGKAELTVKVISEPSKFLTSLVEQMSHNVGVVLQGKLTKTMSGSNQPASSMGGLPTPSGWGSRAGAN